jgi:hypothetical protein
MRVQTGPASRLRIDEDHAEPDAAVVFAHELVGDAAPRQVALLDHRHGQSLRVAYELE